MRGCGCNEFEGCAQSGQSAAIAMVDALRSAGLKTEYRTDATSAAPQEVRYLTSVEMDAMFSAP